MALFVDGPVSNVGDLARIDAGLLDTAASHSIDVAARIQLAHEAIGSDIQLWLERVGARIDQVVAGTAIRDWEAMQSLALVYRDAYFSDLAERYRARWDEYARLSRNAYERFVAAGLGVVTNPVRKALPPVLSSIAGPQPGGAAYACIAWVNAAGGQGEPSDVTSLDIPEGYIMTVSAPEPPANAVGFNVFAGPTLGALTQRNDTPLPNDGTFLYIPGAPTSGRLPGTGQQPDSTRPLARIIPRG